MGNSAVGFREHGLPGGVQENMLMRNGVNFPNIMLSVLYFDVATNMAGWPDFKDWQGVLPVFKALFPTYYGPHKWLQ